ncbi:MAG: S8 family serine peptidase [Phycisphaeraceae bacterium]|nr:S8 family serine peptidase [Phycisphaeraceae bacterium]
MVKTVNRQLKQAWISGCGALLFIFSGNIFAQNVSPSETPTLQPQALKTVGIYDLRAQDPNLTGQGVRVGVIARSVNYDGDTVLNDYQPNTVHEAFSSANFGLFDDGTSEPNVSFHASAVCSILFGQEEWVDSDQWGLFRYQGAVPDAQAKVYELNYFLKTTAVEPDLDLGLDVISLSWGWDGEDWWTRYFEALAQHQGIPVVASIGNGDDAYHRPLYPGASANVIGVGVVDSVTTANMQTAMEFFGLPRPEHSSCGPTDDHRAKPDLVAPSHCLVASPEDANTYEATGNWSSYAAPVVSGVVGMLVQKAGMDSSLSAAVSRRGGNLVIKSLLMTGATKLPFWHKGEIGLEDDHDTPLDHVQGAGMVNAMASYDLLTAGQQATGLTTPRGWDLNELSTPSPFQVYEFSVNDADQMITATLNWNRHYDLTGQFNRQTAKNTDLRLELWAVDPNDPGRDEMIDHSDSLIDNVEHLHSSAREGYTRYQLVVVMHTEDATTPLSERYALAWSVTEQPDQNDLLWNDLNADGIVNAQDYQVLMNNFSTMDSPARYAIGDVNTDGAIDEKDLAILVSNGNKQADWYQ